VLVLDVAIVSVALPAVQAELRFSAGGLSLVVTAYALTFAGLLLFGGRAADLYGPRRLFVIGLAVFTVASLLCGVAPTALVLVGARALQGVGGALMSPAALSLLMALYPEGPERNRALGVWSSLAAAGGAAGLVLGGVLTDLVSWRWVFGINVVLGVPAMLALKSVLPAPTPTGSGRLDLLGATAITVGMAALVYGLSLVGERGVADPVVAALLVVAVVLVAVFVRLEARRQNPLLPLGLFRSRTLSGANLATLALSAVVLGTNFFLTLHLQQRLGLSPLATGLAFLPQTLVAGLASVAAARLASRVGLRGLLLGSMAALAAGSLLLARLGSSSGYVLDVLPGMVLTAVGIGIGFTAGTAAATSGVAPERQGVASAVLATSQQAGGAVGLALLGAIAAASASDPAVGAAVAGLGAAFVAMAVLATLGAVAVVALLKQMHGPIPPAAAVQEAAPPWCTAHTAACAPGAWQLDSAQRSVTHPQS
jgi:EmrB/QacA subfamily drug resistance transporter